MASAVGPGDTNTLSLRQQADESCRPPTSESLKTRAQRRTNEPGARLRLLFVGRIVSSPAKLGPGGAFLCFSTMTATSIARLAQLHAHLTSAVGSGGAASSSVPLILYDLKSNLTNNKAWSPNVWKTRLVLNYKRIPYETHWVSFSEVKPTLDALGCQPSTTRRGQQTWTVPTIRDPSSGQRDPTIVTDSFLIAEYLDAKYPERPVLPNGSRAIFAVFGHWVDINIMAPLLQLAVAVVPGILDELAREWFIENRGSIYGKDPLQVCQGEERAKAWLTLKKGLSRLADHLSHNDVSNFVMGNAVTYADFYLAALLIWTQKLPTTCDPGLLTLWDGIKDCNEGRWTRFMAEMDEYRQNQA